MTRLEVIKKQAAADQEAELQSIFEKRTAAERHEPGVRRGALRIKRKKESGHMERKAEAGRTTVGI